MKIKVENERVYLGDISFTIRYYLYLGEELLIELFNLDKDKARDLDNEITKKIADYFNRKRII